MHIRNAQRRKTAQTVTLQHAKTICHMLQNPAVVLTEWLKNAEKQKTEENWTKLLNSALFSALF